MVQIPSSRPLEQPETQSEPSSQMDHNESILGALVDDIQRYEAIVSAWDESQQATVSGLKRSIEALHREALVRLIRSVKQESLSALRHAVEDDVVYSLLRYYDLVKPPTPPLAQRIELALAEVRPGLKEHNGDVVLVAIHPPDTVEVSLTGACSHCPASSLTLKQGIEESIKRYCPEIHRVIATETSHHLPQTSVPISPLAGSDRGWLVVTSLAEVPQGRLLAMKLAGKPLILTRIGSEVVCYHNACSHQGLAIEGGSIHSIGGGGLEQMVLTCPSHGFQFRLATGDCLTSPQTPLQKYPVDVRDGQVFVQLWEDSCKSE